MRARKNPSSNPEAWIDLFKAVGPKLDARKISKKAETHAYDQGNTIILKAYQKAGLPLPGDKDEYERIAWYPKSVREHVLGMIREIESVGLDADIFLASFLQPRLDGLVNDFDGIPLAVATAILGYEDAAELASEFFPVDNETISLLRQKNWKQAESLMSNNLMKTIVTRRNEMEAAVRAVEALGRLAEKVRKLDLRLLYMRK